MKVEQRYVINNRPVDFVTEFGGLKVYGEGDDEAKVFYFVDKKDVVVKRLILSADYGQGVGYLSEVAFRSME